jgi:hypothetical protein
MSDAKKHADRAASIPQGKAGAAQVGTTLGGFRAVASQLAPSPHGHKPLADTSPCVVYSAADNWPTFLARTPSIGQGMAAVMLAIVADRLKPPFAGDGKAHAPTKEWINSFSVDSFVRLVQAKVAGTLPLDVDVRRWCELCDTYKVAVEVERPQADPSDLTLDLRGLDG